MNHSARLYETRSSFWTINQKTGCCNMALQQPVFLCYCILSFPSRFLSHVSARRRNSNFLGIPLRFLHTTESPAIGKGMPPYDFPYDG